MTLTTRWTFLFPVSRHCSVHAIKFAAAAAEYIYWRFIPAHTKIYRWKRIIICGVRAHGGIDNSNSEIFSTGPQVGGRERLKQKQQQQQISPEFCFFNHPGCLLGEANWVETEISLRA